MTGNGTPSLGRGRGLLEAGAMAGLESGLAEEDGVMAGPGSGLAVEVVMLPARSFQQLKGGSVKVAFCL